MAWSMALGRLCCREPLQQCRSVLTATERCGGCQCTQKWWGGIEKRKKMYTRSANNVKNYCSITWQVLFTLLCNYYLLNWCNADRHKTSYCMAKKILLFSRYSQSLVNWNVHKPHNIPQSRSVSLLISCNFGQVINKCLDKMSKVLFINQHLIN